MIAKVYSAIPDGYDGHIVEVEGDTTKSLPCFNIVGMANKTITEARERVRAAITNSEFIFPAKRVTVNLAPAELAKNGSHLDLPIALTVLILSGQLQESDLAGKLFVGELSLDGYVKPIRGIINIIETAKKAGFTEVILPIGNLPQAKLIPGIKLTGVNTLTEVVFLLNNLPYDDFVVKNTKTVALAKTSPEQKSVVKNNQTDTNNIIYLDQIRGQTLAKRALTIAIAGHHNILFTGPPGSGKTMLARAAINLLPPPSLEEQISITKIHSLHALTEEIVTSRPFRAPHHTASAAAMIGGGTQITPGEISLAHHGILFLDELPEFTRPILEALRQPLEDKTISVARATKRATFPANFMLIATMNPCPCGFYGDPTHECTCSSKEITNYQKRISGPILDRIDLVVKVNRLDTSDLLKPAPDTIHPNTEHNVVKNTITECLRIQRRRFLYDDLYNANLTPKQISQYIKLTDSATKLLKRAVDKLNLSARAYFKVLKVAQTIADLDQKTEIGPEQISESLSFRQHF